MRGAHQASRGCPGASHSSPPKPPRRFERILSHLRGRRHDRGLGEQGRVFGAADDLSPTGELVELGLSVRRPRFLPRLATAPFPRS